MKNFNINNKKNTVYKNSISFDLSSKKEVNYIKVLFIFAIILFFTYLVLNGLTIYKAAQRVQLISYLDQKNIEASKLEKKYNNEISKLSKEYALAQGFSEVKVNNFVYRLDSLASVAFLYDKKQNN